MCTFHPPQLKSKYYTRLAGGEESPVVIREDQKKGRGLFARSDILQGQLITSEKPYVVFSNERADPYLPGSTDANFRPKHCDHCLKQLKSIEPHTQPGHEHCDHSYKGQTLRYGEKCDRCNVIYCSRECKEEARKLYHSLECQCLPEEIKTLEDHCRKDKRKFPLMAMRVMARQLTEVM